MDTESVIDPRMGLRGGVRYRDPSTGRLVRDPTKPRELTFRCKFCGEEKPLDEITTITRFFPILVACRECKRKIG